MTEPPGVTSPDTAASLEFAVLASGERIATAAAALERNGIRPVLAAAGADARGLVRSLLTDGAEVASASGRQLGPLVSGARHAILVIGAYRPGAS